MGDFAQNVKKKNVYISSLIGGGVAGLSVDISLFPLDTIKTRLQSKQGFWKSGGFTGIYKGIGPQVVGSAPQAALFFLTYESVKYYTEASVPVQTLPFIHMAAASLGEVVACFVRCPMEVVKQRRQTSHKNSFHILMSACRHEGFRKGLYRGYGSMLVREVPFSFIQFPVLEYLKRTYRHTFKNNIPLESWEVATCGALAGGFAAAVTTPLDVIKTRITLGDRKEASAGKLTIRRMFVVVYQEKGIKGLFAGFVPRVIWITLGGYIFFGMYDLSRSSVSDYLLKYDDDYELCL